MLQNHVRSPSKFWPGTQTFMPHKPVMMFMGKTIVPRTVSLFRVSFVCSERSFMRILICAKYVLDETPRVLQFGVSKYQSAR